MTPLIKWLIEKMVNNIVSSFNRMDHDETLLEGFLGGLSLLYVWTVFFQE